MFAQLREWLDHRTGYQRLVHVLLIEEVPGGAKWRYVWGSCLAFVFGIQLITGVLLMTSYSAGDSTAWSSVHFIQYQMDFGWLIRGLHHFGSQVMVVLLGLHMLQVVIAGAHLPPREVNWWLGLALLGAVLGLSLTGYLLPWDQKGYWATQVATNIAGNLPGPGALLKKIIVGGPEYGHHTLTRFYALHVAILPPLVIGLIIAHLTVFRRHGVRFDLATVPVDEEGEPLKTEKDGMFWPDQAFRDMVVSMGIFGIMLSLVLFGHGHKVEPSPEIAEARSHSLYTYWAKAGLDGRGANLDAPADAATESYPARPEWYFLPLFQLLKYFKGDQEIIGTVVIPNGILVLLALLPLFGVGPLRMFGHVLGVVVVTLLLVGAGSLTLLAIADDMAYPLAQAVVALVGTKVVPIIGLVLLARLGLLAILPLGSARRTVYVVGSAVIALACLGAGAVTYVALEKEKAYVAAGFPETDDDVKASRGGALPWADQYLYTPIAAKVENRMKEGDRKPTDKNIKFQSELTLAGQSAERAVNLATEGVPAAGARYLLRGDPRTQGEKLFKQNCATCHTYGTKFDNKNPTASDLEGWGTAEWIRGLLRDPASPRYFGHTKLTAMSSWVKREQERAQKKGEESKKTFEANLDGIARWLGEHPRGKIDEKFEKTCADCHTFKGTGGGSTPGPDFTGYGDAEWLRMMIMSPDHAQRYGEKNQMPAFRDLEGPAADITKQEYPTAVGKEPSAVKLFNLSDFDRELIIRWLLQDPSVVFGGEPVAPSARK